MDLSSTTKRARGAVLIISLGVLALKYNVVGISKLTIFGAELNFNVPILITFLSIALAYQYVFFFSYWHADLQLFRTNKLHELHNATAAGAKCITDMDRLSKTAEKVRSESFSSEYAKQKIDISTGNVLDATAEMSKICRKLDWNLSILDYSLRWRLFVLDFGIPTLLTTWAAYAALS